MSGYASTAKKVRELKEKSPELFCKNPKCLWRVKVEGRQDNPCRNHPLPKVTNE